MFLKYGPDGEKVIRQIDRASRPGRRLYRRRPDQAGARRARHRHPQHQPRRHERPPGPRQKVGGELLCTVW